MTWPDYFAWVQKDLIARAVGFVVLLSIFGPLIWWRNHRKGGP